MNEQEKKGTQPVRVHGRYPRKSGINMNMREDRTREIRRCIRCNKACLGGMMAHKGVHCIYERKETT